MNDLHTLHIHSDSRSALQAIDNRKLQSQLVLDTVTKLNILGVQNVKVILYWIKAHFGYPGNEKADSEAKQGTRKETVDTIVGLNQTALKNKLWLNIYDRWKERWTNSGTCRMSKEFYEGPDKKKAKEVLKLSRKQLSTVIALTTGHNNLNYFKHLTKACETPLCRMCEEEDETFHHLWKECPVYSQEQREREGINLKEKRPQNHWTCKEVLKFANKEEIKQALKFQDPEQ